MRKEKNEKGESLQNVILSTTKDLYRVVLTE